MEADEILAHSLPPGASAQRAGITGPPGAGKSSIIAALAQRRLARSREVAVLAVDPTSPISHGSLLGDRIRMEMVAHDPRLFIRSVPSGHCTDGLCRNVVGLLDTLDAAGFADLILETVGVGQVSYEARRLVDTFVLVLVPESGDTIQAMKAGALETADIYVINKSDLPGAGRLVEELRSILELRRADGWKPPVVLASTRTGDGLEAVETAIDLHYATLTPQRRDDLQRQRRAYQLRALLLERVEALMGCEDALAHGTLSTAYAALLDRLTTRACTSAWKAPC